MQYFYDGAVRRYLIQAIRVLSNFTVKYSDGTLVRVPVIYGDADRQVANIVRQNSENTVISCPKIAVYINQLTLDRDRLSDSTYVGKLHIRERGIAVDQQSGYSQYTQEQGRNYTVERLMPTPFKLSLKVDIWASSTEQKLQILEQILVLFNPSLEIQATDNYIDWTSLSVLNLDDVNWSSRSIPVGTDSPIDIATLSLSAPIWISPPVKVKHLGIVTKIVASIYQDADKSWSNIDGLGSDLSGGTTSFSNLLDREVITISNYKLKVSDSCAYLLPSSAHISSPVASVSETFEDILTENWYNLLSQYPGSLVPGVSKIFLTQVNGTTVIGAFDIDPTDNRIANVTWDPDTFPSDDTIITTGDREAGGGRSPGTFDAIIDPTKTYFGNGIETRTPGDRYLILEDIGSNLNTNGPVAWKNLDNSDFVAKANDVIEWQTNKWAVIFDSSNSKDTSIYLTNIFNSRKVQYYWNGVYWSKTFEGDYDNTRWRIEL